MIASKEQGTLRDTYIAANDNLIKIINPAIFTQPAIITYHQVPRQLDDDIVLDDQALANLRTKGTEQSHLDSHKGIP